MYVSLDCETVDETAHDLRIDGDVTEVIRIYRDDGEPEEATQVLEIEFDPDATQEN